MEMMACAQWLRSCPRHRRQRSLGQPSWKTTDGHHANAATHRTRDPSTGCAVQTWEDSFRLPDHKTSVLLFLYIFLKEDTFFASDGKNGPFLVHLGRKRGRSSPMTQAVLASTRELPAHTRITISSISFPKMWLLL